MLKFVQERPSVMTKHTLPFFHNKMGGEESPIVLGIFLRNSSQLILTQRFEYLLSQ